MLSTLTLWLVEDEPGYRAAFERLIATSDEFRLDAVFEQYASLLAHLETYDASLVPDLIIMDLMLPGMSGYEATKDLRQRLPNVPVVVLTSLDNPESVFKALQAGASGYIVKGTLPERMFTAMREAHAGGTYFAPSIARFVLGHFAAPAPPDESLSERECEVLRELAAGRTKAGIAEVLFLSPHTVDKHLRNIYRKLHVNTAAAAAAKGVRTGLV